MAFGKMGIRAWSREWRQSDWRETIPLASGRECPRCWATVCGGKSWRAHWSKHDDDDDQLAELDQALRTCIESVRVIAVELEKRGVVTIRGGGGEDPEVPELRGRVIGNGPLPEEMRGGGE